MSDIPQPAGGVPVIIRGRITKVEAEKFADIPVSGFELNVLFDAVAANNQFLEVRFTYTAKYKENVGLIKMSGILLLEMEPAMASRIAVKWNAENRFDDEVAQSLLNNIHYKCGTEAVLPAKVVELPSPLLPQKISVTRGAGPTRTVQ